jgi:YfiH family protein
MTLSDGFTWTTEPWGAALRSTSLSEFADHFFTTRQLWLRGESEAADWAAAAASIGVPAPRLLRLHQVHGRHAVVVRAGTLVPEGAAGDAGSAADAGLAADAGCGADGRWPEADVIVSNDPAVALAIQVADCVPLLMADRRSGAVAGVHAGWRGSAAGAAVAAVDALEREFDARPEDLVVVQGPSIGACCYEVGADLVEAFEAAGHRRSIDRWFSKNGDGRLRLDLWTANADQLIQAGVRPEAIHQSKLCTASHPEWFASYRRDGKGTGRIAAVIRARTRPAGSGPLAPAASF